MKKIFCIAGILVYSVSFGQPNRDSAINRMNWLIGSWKGMHNGKPFYEAWPQTKNLLVNFAIDKWN